MKINNRRTAKFLKNILGWAGDVRLYELSRPVEYHVLMSDEKRKTKFVLVSAVVVRFTGEPETYIFPSDKDGNALNMLELDGSYRGGLDHEKALKDAGYTIVE